MCVGWPTFEFMISETELNFWICCLIILQGGCEKTTGSESFGEDCNPSRLEDAAPEAGTVLGLECHTEGSVPETTSAEGKPSKVKGKRVKKRSMCFVSHFSAGS